MGQNYISEAESLFFVTFEQQFSSSLTIRMHLSLCEGLIKASGHHGTFGFHQWLRQWMLEKHGPPILSSAS